MRLFVAFALPQPLRDDLTDLAGAAPGARWVAAENLHLTLRFIGETPNPLADEIDLSLATLRGRAPSIAFSGVSLFERNGRPTALRARIERSDALEHLQAKIEIALQRAGVTPERRRFQPHVTLARVDGVPPDRLASWVQARNLFRSGPHRLPRFTLFSSQPGPDEPVYVPEVDYELA